MSTCPQCDGTGLDGFGGGEEDAPCPWCDGAGKVRVIREHRATCPLCGPVEIRQQAPRKAA
jgi:DnaJ-class molecular chaperone